MSQYFFAVHQGPKILTKVNANKRDKIARAVGGSGCGYTYYYDKALHVWRGWGYSRNLGEPFDSAIAREIKEAWAKEEGTTPNKGEGEE